jgi:hypothetical protein
MSKVEFVSYIRQSIGKLVSSSKHKYIWKLKIDEKDYTIEFYKSKRGRRSVFVNGDKVFEANILAADGATYPFTIKTGGRRLELTIFKVVNGEYDLRVGKITYFQALREKQKSTDEIVDSYANKLVPQAPTASFTHFKVADDSDEESDRRPIRPSLHSQPKHKNNQEFGWPSKENLNKEETSLNHDASWRFGKGNFDGNFKWSSNPFDAPQGFSSTRHTDRHFTFEPKPFNSEITPDPFGHAAKEHSHHSESVKAHSHIRHSSIEYPHSHSSQSPQKRSSVNNPFNQPPSNTTSTLKKTSPVKPISHLIDLVDLDSPPANSYIPRATQSVRNSTQNFTFPEVSKPSPNPLSVETESNHTNTMMSNPMLGSPKMTNYMMTNPMMTNPMMGNPMMGNPMMSNPMMGNPMMMNQYMTSMMMGQMMNNPYMQHK